MAQALDVRFYTGCQDPVEVALRLLRKCRGQAYRTAVLGPMGPLRVLSARLWALEGFWAHAGPEAGTAAVRGRSPIVLSVEPLGENGLDALIHLGHDMPEVPEGVQHLFEVVGEDPESREAGRSRFRAYRAQGVALRHHEVDA